MDFHEGNYRLNESYVKAIIAAGGVPFSIPYMNEKDMEQLIQHIDGLLLTGGGDINPFLFGEEPQPNLGRVLTVRDENEIQWTELALKHNIPILAICRGIQILNVALGGTIYQDIYSQNKRDLLLHTQTSPRYETAHLVYIKDSSQFQQIMMKSKIYVNSFHHQAIKDIASQLSIVGQASDGIIEAVEHKQARFCIGVQWHPEELAIKGEEHSMRLFKTFVEAASSTR